MPIDNVTRAALSNGLTVLVHHVPSSDVVAIVTHVKAGYFDEPDDVVGISHVVEHMFFKGTPRFGVGEIAKTTKAAGGYLNAHTIYDHTAYYVVLPASRFTAGLEVQADAYANSLIDADELARELEVIIQEAKRKTDNPSAVATETLYELLHDRHRMRRWRIGHEAGLRRLTRDAVHGFYRTHYRPSNTILSIAGGMDPDRALAEVERLYGGITDAPVERSVGAAENGSGGFRYRELEGDVTQTQLVFGWRAPGIFAAAAPALDVAATALAVGRASRLYRAVRERELAASVGASSYAMADIGVFTIHLETEPGKTLDAARATWGEVLRLGADPLPGHEVGRAVSIYESRWLRGFETMEGRASFLAGWEALGDWRRGEEYLAAVRAVTADGIVSAVCDHLAPDAAGVLAFRPARTAPIAANVDAMRSQLTTMPMTVPPGSAPRPMPAIARRAARFEEEVSGVRVYRTERGVPILVRRRPGSAFAYIGAYAGNGASSDPAELAGQTLLLCRTAVKGTRTRSKSEIAESTEALGSSIATRATADALGWSLAVPLSAFEPAIELLADVTQHPVFDVQALEIERTAALSSLALLRDDMFSYPLRLMWQAAFGEHPYARAVAGTEDGLAAITPAEVSAVHNARIARGSLTVAIVADGDPDILAEVAASVFGDAAPAKCEAVPPPQWLRGGIREERRDKAQTALTLAFPGPGRRDPDRFAIDLVATIASGLGGRFFDELRDRRSLAYTVNAFAAVRPLAGLFGTYIATSPDKEDAAREGLASEVKRLRDQPPSDDELLRAQEYTIGSETIRRESGSALLSEMVDAWLFGELAELERYDAEVRTITREDVASVIAKYLKPELAVLGIVRGRGREV